jgi:hypothetical protein
MPDWSADEDRYMEEYRGETKYDALEQGLGRPEGCTCHNEPTEKDCFCVVCGCFAVNHPTGG